MSGHCNGVSGEGDNNRDNESMMEDVVSFYEEMKEEKAVSFREREEDECQRPLSGQQQQQPSPPLHQCELKLESELELESKSKSKNNPQSQRIEDEPMERNGPRPINDKEQEQELHQLRKRLESIRKRRRRIQKLARIDCVEQQKVLLERLNARRRDRNQMVDEYASTLKGRDSASLFLECARRWNVLNDCFYIWIDGKHAFATINGCRLGGEAVPLPTELLVSARDNNNNNNTRKGKWVSPTKKHTATNTNTNTNTNNSHGTRGSSPPRRRLLGLFGASNSNDTNTNTNTNSNAVGASSAFRRKLFSPAPTITEPTRIPWLEINAALGHACLLLKILQESSSKNAGTGMKFTHELHPMGSTSKIGIRFGTPDSGTGVLAAAAGFGSIILSSSSSSGNSNGNGTNSIANGTTPIVYNLFFEEASGFSFFKNNVRDFNWALQAFLQCIAEAAAQQTDKTIAIPHAIRHEKAASEYHAGIKNGPRTYTNDNSANFLNGGEWTIGGLSICHPSQTAAAGNVTGDQGGGRVGGTTVGRTAGISAVNSAALEWTKACRYVLTDLKWLVAYSAKHVDR